MSLSETCKRLGMLNPSIAVDVGPLENGWFTASALTCADNPWLEQGLSLMAARYHTGMDHLTRAAFLFDQYVRDVAAIAVAAYLLESRVPELGPENIALRYETYLWEENGHTGEGDRLRVRLLSERMAVLPGDPAAHRPEVLVSEDKAALRERLRTGFEAHLAPLIERLYLRTRLARRALWRLAADSLASLFLGVGEAVGDDRLGLDDGLALIKTPGSPLNNRQTGYVTLSVSAPDSTHQVASETFRARGGCCRFYTLPEGEYCTTCVLRNPHERDCRLREYLFGKLVANSPRNEN